MKIGVVNGDQVVVKTGTGLSAYSAKLGRLEAKEMAEDLIGAAKILVRNQFSSRQELIEFVLDALEQEV